jgi:Multicopper oxidase
LASSEFGGTVRTQLPSALTRKDDCTLGYRSAATVKYFGPWISEKGSQIFSSSFVHIVNMRFISQFPALLLSVLSLVGMAAANTQCHDKSFVPDAVLRVTQQNITQSCLPSKSNVLINGTSPGPELRLLEGQTYWIRVYNDMTSNNLTMVLPALYHQNVAAKIDG